MVFVARSVTLSLASESGQQGGVKNPRCEADLRRQAKAISGQ